MFKKMVVLYFVSTFFNFLVASEKHWYVSLTIVVFSYLFLFFDLSGYSDMAIAVRLSYGIYSTRKLQKALGGGIIYAVLA